MKANLAAAEKKITPPQWGVLGLLVLTLFNFSAWAEAEAQSRSEAQSNSETKTQSATVIASDLVKAAQQRTLQTVTYSGQYYSIAYPGGDVPADIGVCTDVVIRSYRMLDIDLQQRVHEDMQKAFGEYPNIWGLNKPDANIDHRRVPNLQTFFQRQAASLSISEKAEDYFPGDIVSWMLPGNLPHIGIVSNKRSADGQRYLIVHNIGRGPKEEDFLFGAKITGHYRYFPSR